MLKKLLSGEFSVKETFWKFGLLGVFFFWMCSKIFEKLLYARIKGLTIPDYYLRYFNPVHPDIFAMFWTLCYVFGSIFFVYYGIAVVLGIWRSTNDFERSALLKFIIRMVMLVYVGAMLYSVLKGIR